MVAPVCCGAVVHTIPPGLNVRPGTFCNQPQGWGEIEMTNQRLENLALRFAEKHHSGVGVNAMTGMIDQALELGLNCKREFAASELIAIGRRVSREVERQSAR